jgi:uncharacterized protein (TIGR03067 family)
VLDLSLNKEDVEQQQKDKDGVLVWGRTLHVLRRIEIGKLERFVLEKDSQGRPTSWVELCLIRNSGTEHFPMPGSPLPFSAERPNLAKQDSLKTELEGVWRPVAMEYGGSRVGAAETKQIGKLGIKGNRLFSPDQKPSDSRWQGWLKLEPGKSPKRITIFDNGFEGELKFHGIYMVDGDELTICLNQNGKDTAIPEEFRTREGSPFMLVHFKREQRRPSQVARQSSQP